MQVTYVYTHMPILTDRRIDGQMAIQIIALTTKISYIHLQCMW